METNREVDQAVAALSAEILRLLPIDEAARSSSGITLQNAISRLATAIVCHSNQMPGNLPAPMTEIVLPALANPEPV
jgi:hypothetical protein